VARHRSLVQGRPVRWVHAGVGTALLVVFAFWLAPPKPASGLAGTNSTVSFATVQQIMEQRCVACHNAQLASKNVALHSPELIKKNAQTIYQQVAVLKLMPMNNATQITELERVQVKQWFEAGAPVP
jgi:uncharacterized membrane protein